MVTPTITKEIVKSAILEKDCKHSVRFQSKNDTYRPEYPSQFYIKKEDWAEMGAPDEIEIVLRIK